MKAGGTSSNPPRKGVTLSQGIVAVVLVIALAFIKYEFFPNRRQRQTQAEVDEAVRESNERLEKARNFKPAPLPKTGVPACDEVAQLAGHTWRCPNDAARKQIDDGIMQALTDAGKASGAVAGCQAALEKINALEASTHCE